MEKGRALAQVDMDFILNRYIISTTKKQETILEEYYWEQNKNQLKEQSLGDYFLSELLDRT
ncbi:MAG: hypothetical protein GOP50_08060 [Candidatus Heimdallarchaeota archaeon]|nr:hypothetical protein [Candidatus Heimdallarchaeota archaeon]